MDLYLLRHGRSIANEQKLVCGCLDYPLSEMGETQARKVCLHLNRIAFTRIYSSSLSRAIQTIAALEDIALASIEPSLVELNTGELSHMTLEELWARDDRYRKPWLYPDLEYPGGERFHEMVKRISAWYTTTSSQWSDDDVVLIVGHEGTLRSIYSVLLDLDLECYPDFAIGNCDYFHFEIKSGDVVRHKLVPLSSLSGELI